MKKLIYLLPLLLLAFPVHAQNIYTAASVNEADVKDCILGTGLNTCLKQGAGSPATHTAVNGDEIIIPAGNGLWTSQLSFTACIYLHGNATLNTLPSQFGAGTTNTNIWDQFNSTSPLIHSPGVSPTGCNGFTSGHFLHISALSIKPCNGVGTPNAVCTGAITAGGVPIDGWGLPDPVNGTPELRIDNIDFEGWSNTANGGGTNAKISVSDFYGVIDHDTCKVLAGSGGQEFINTQQANWQGVPTLPSAGYGDNSYHSLWPTTSSTTNLNQLIFENFNSNYCQTETEFPPINMPGTGGGSRLEVRFGSFNGLVGTPDVSWHGLDTSGRPFQFSLAVAYGNTHSCNASECNSLDLGPYSQRDGALIAFGDSMTATGGATQVRFEDTIEHERAFRQTSFGISGVSFYDKNDGEVITGPFTATTGTNSTNMVLTSSGWTSNSFTINTSSPGAILGSVLSMRTGCSAVILTNPTGTTATLGAPTSFGLNGACTGTPFQSGDQIYVMQETLYGAGIATAGTSGSNLTTASHSYTTNQWQQSGTPYSLVDVTQGLSSVIASNTGNTFTYDFGPSQEGGAGLVWAANDIYVIVRASQSLGAPGTRQEQIPPPTAGVRVPNPFQPTAILAPTYLGPFTLTGATFQNTVQATQPLQYVNNTNYFNEPANQAANTSPTSPFNGLSGGVGHGTFANMPTSCSGATGYFASNGTWNTSGNGFPSYQLYTCQSGTFQLYYVPPPYPHPLITGGGSPTVATPTFSPGAGSYASTQLVTITCSTGGATITYTTDGSTPIPGSHGTVYAGPFQVTASQLVQAIGSLAGSTNSSIASANYQMTSGPASGMFALNWQAMPMPVAPVPALSKSTPNSSYVTSAGVSQDGKTFVNSLSLSLTGTNFSLNGAACTFDGTSVPCTCGSITQCVVTVPASVIPIPTTFPTAHAIQVSFPAATIPVLN